MKVVLGFMLALASVFVPTMSAFAQDRSVERVQRALVLAGFDVGEVDGVWGARTRSALVELAEGTNLESIPEGPTDFDSALERALVDAFNSHSETLEAEEAHLQQLVTIPDARHLLERTGIGAHPSEVKELLGLTRSEAVSLMIQRLDGRNTSAPLPSWITAEPFPQYWIRWDYEEEQQQAFRTQRDGEIGTLRSWWVREMIATENPQAERLILLWHNHFVTAYSGVEEESHAIAFQHQTFRNLGHGNFRDLLTAVIRDPAMLNYLDNSGSRREAPNENLARELMELFVLGEGNYSEADVREVSRALTGYAYSRIRRLEFEFNPWDHDADTKSLFGVTGNFNGDDVVSILLSRPEAADFIAKRFWSVYVSEFNFDIEEIEKIAEDFRESDYEIKLLVRKTLTSRGFWEPTNKATIVKSPVDIFVGTIRTTGILPDWWNSLPNRMAAIGQNLFEAPNVAGWPGGADWLTPSRLLMRSEMISDIAGAEPASADDDTAAMMAQMLVPNPAEEAMFQSVYLRYAAEDFSGPPQFQVTAIETNSLAEVTNTWKSGPITAVGGVDTERFGRLDFEALPWQLAKLELPRDFHPSSFKISFLNDHCCGPGGSDGGDRNLFIDWISVEERIFPARVGKQKTQCSDPNADSEPGRMYCSGTVTVSEFETLSTSVLNKESKNSSNALQIDRAVFEWADSYSKDLERVTFSIGLLAPRLGEVAAEAMIVQIIRRDHEAGRRISLRLSSRRCFPDCIGGPMPRSAYKHDESGELVLDFVLSGPEWDEERAQWNQLSDEQRRFVSALWMAVPELIAVSRQGRNWRDRNAEQFCGAWSDLFHEVKTLLPGSRYASLAPAEGVKILLDETAEPNMMMAMMGRDGTQPIRIAGLDPTEARFDSPGWTLSDARLSDLFLAAAPVQSDQETKDLAIVLSDPVYNLK